MKSVAKILFITSMVFYPLSFPALAMELEETDASSYAGIGTKAENGYICVADERPPHPHPDNPYKTCHTDLSDHFLEQQRNPSYQFPTSGDNVIELGTYRVDTNMHLGSGDDGTVYLARHLPSGIYAAAKSRGMTFGQDAYHDEYKNLKALNQLYAAWSKEREAEGYAHVYLIIPFVDGRIISHYSYSSVPLPWIQTTLENTQLQFSDLSAGIRLIRSMANQLIYVTQKGVSHDQNVVNILITNDYQNVVLIDFGYSGDLSKSSSCDFPPLRASEFNIPIYGFCCNYILDTRKYVNQIREGQITGPSPIVNFLKVINTDHWSLKLDTFLNALETLEKSTVS